VHEAAEAHPTPSRWPAEPGGDGGVGSIDQAVPFHTSASVSEPAPTAVQALAEVYRTPMSPGPSCGVMAGVGWIDQEVPFHASASVPPGPEALKKVPTAVQAPPEGHETPLR